MSDQPAVVGTPRQENNKESGARTQTDQPIDSLTASTNEQRVTDQSEDEVIVNAVTAAMREADRVFEKVGGSTRHHVRDCLLPILNRNGWRVVHSDDYDDLVESLSALLMDIHNGTLVRDVTRDAEQSWSIRMIAFVKRLQAAQVAIAKAEGR